MIRRRTSDRQGNTMRGSPPHPLRLAPGTLTITADVRWGLPTYLPNMPLATLPGTWKDELGTGNLAQGGRPVTGQKSRQARQRQFLSHLHAASNHSSTDLSRVFCMYISKDTTRWLDSSTFPCAYPVSARYSCSVDNLHERPQKEPFDVTSSSSLA